MNHVWIPLVVLAILSVSVSPFYVYLTSTSAQCFFNNVYKEQNLLIEIQTPIISLAHKIVLTVRNGDKIVLQRDVVNQLKLTVPRETNQINNAISTEGMEYQTCLKIQAQAIINQAEVVQKQGYLLSIKLYNNFDHKLQNVKYELAQSKIDYGELQLLSKKLGYVNSEQIVLHQVNEAKQKLSQAFLDALKNRVIIYSMLEIVMVVMFTYLQIKMLRGYLNGLSVV